MAFIHVVTSRFDLRVPSGANCRLQVSEPPSGFLTGIETVEVLEWYKYEWREQPNSLKGVGLGTVLLVGLLVAFPWAIASMVAGMGSVSPGVSTAPGSSNSTIAATSDLAGAAGQIGENEVALFLILGVFLIEATFYIRSKSRLFWELVTIGASVVAAFIAILLAYGLSNLSAPGIVLDLGGNSLVVYAATLGLAAAGALLAVSLLLRSARRMPVVGNPRPVTRDRRGTTTLGAQGLDYGGLTASGSKGIVFACYSAFCLILSKLGVGNPPSRTPRELASEAGTRTSLDRDLVRRLTSLFERPVMAAKRWPRGRPTNRRRFWAR